MLCLLIFIALLLSALLLIALVLIASMSTVSRCSLCSEEHIDDVMLSISKRSSASTILSMFTSCYSNAFLLIEIGNCRLPNECQFDLNIIRSIILLISIDCASSTEIVSCVFHNPRGFFCCAFHYCELQRKHSNIIRMIIAVVKWFKCLQTHHLRYGD